MTEEERVALAEVLGVSGTVDALTDLVSDQRITLPFAAVALLVAIVLGAMHTIAPGQGKTVIAAYLVGQRGDRSPVPGPVPIVCPAGCRAHLSRPRTRL